MNSQESIDGHIMESVVQKPDQIAVDNKFEEECRSKEDEIPLHLMDDFLGAMLFPHFDQKADKHFMSFTKQPKRQLFKKKNTSANLIKDLFCPAHTSQTIKFFGGKKAMEFERERSKNSGFVIHPWSKLR